MLIRTRAATARWHRLIDAGITVRLFAAGWLAGCLRITVGTPAKTGALLAG